MDIITDGIKSMDHTLALGNDLSSVMPKSSIKENWNELPKLLSKKCESNWDGVMTPKLHLYVHTREKGKDLT